MPGLLRDTAQLRVSGGFSARHCQRARLQLPERSRQSTGGSCHLCRTQRGSARGATGTQTQTVHSRSRGAPPVTPAELGEGGAATLAWAGAHVAAAPSEGQAVAGTALRSRSRGLLGV